MPKPNWKDVSVVKIMGKPEIYVGKVSAPGIVTDIGPVVTEHAINAVMCYMRDELNEPTEDRADSNIIRNDVLGTLQYRPAVEHEHDHQLIYIGPEEHARIHATLTEFRSVEPHVTHEIESLLKDLGVTMKESEPDGT